MDFFYDAISLKNGRSSNMDRVSMCVNRIDGADVGLFLLADGVGSAELGEESAEFVVNELSDWFFSQVTRRHLGTSMSQTVFQLNQELVELCHGRSGATTLSALLLGPNKIFFCHVGDSRIYQAGEDLTKPWAQLTVDHLTEEGKLRDYLGKKSHLKIDSWEQPRSAGQYLLCSDGFYRRLPWETASPTLATACRQTVRGKLETMALEVLRQGETDNCSALLLVVEESPVT